MAIGIKTIIETVAGTITDWFKKKTLKREIIVNVEKLETRVAVLENDKLEEYMVEHPEEERLVGSVFRGVVQNPIDHPMGGGEGRSSGGGHPVSPWGQLAKGKRTRHPKKPSNKFIVERRRK